MQSPSMLPPDENLVPKSRKKRTVTQKASISQQGHVMKGLQEPMIPHLTKPSKKGPKKVFENGAPPMFQQVESSPLDLSTDSSGNEYRALRRKFLLLEEENFGIGRQLTEVEDEVKALEDEKLALLDELVVLEGLVGVPELPSQRLS